MEKKVNLKNAEFAIVYFLIAAFQVFFIANDDFIGKLITRIVTPILLFLIYFKSSEKRDYIFIIAIFATLLSNLMMTFSGVLWNILGILFFIMYRIISIIIVLNFTQKIRLFSVVIATVPFITLLFYVVILTYDSLGIHFYPAVLNAILISIMAGIALSKYVFEDDATNNPLLLSTLLFTFVIVLYILEHFYMNLRVFSVVRSVFYLSGHYIFLRYVVLSEKSKSNNP